jgi:hypothetical protein
MLISSNWNFKDNLNSCAVSSIGASFAGAEAEAGRKRDSATILWYYVVSIGMGVFLYSMGYLSLCLRQDPMPTA